MSIKPRVILKVVLCGCKEVGKSSILLRASDKKVPDRYVPTIGVDHGLYKCISNNQYVTIDMWEISGDPRFEGISNTFIANTNFIIFCFDLSRPKTFLELPNYIARVERLGKTYGKSIVGIKSDLEKKVFQGKEYAESIEASYYEINALHESEVIFLMHSIANDGVINGTYDMVMEEKEEDVVANTCCYM